MNHRFVHYRRSMEIWRVNYDQHFAEALEGQKLGFWSRNVRNLLSRWQVMSLSSSPSVCNIITLNVLLQTWTLISIRLHTNFMLISSHKLSSTSLHVLFSFTLIMHPTPMHTHHLCIQSSAWNQYMVVSLLLEPVKNPTWNFRTNQIQVTESSSVCVCLCVSERERGASICKRER